HASGTGHTAPRHQALMPTLPSLSTTIPPTAGPTARTSSSRGPRDYTLHTFKKTQLTPYFWSEGATYGDFNHDGKMDVVSGPYWWEGPDFTKRHEYYPANKSFTRKKPDGTEEKIPGFEGALGQKNTY